MVNKWLPLTSMTVAHFINDFFQYLVPLLLPLLIPEFGLSYLESGLLVGVYLGTAVGLNPIMGHFADVYRRRKLTLCLGLALYGISVSSLQFAQDYTSLMLISVVMGVGFSAYHPQATKVITTLYKEKKGKFMGIHGIGGGIGFATTPLLLVPLAYSLGWRYAVSFLFIPACLAALLLWIFVKEPEVEVVRRKNKMVWRPIILLTLVSGLSYYVFKGFTTFLPIYFVAVRSTSAIEMGLLTSLAMGTGIFAAPLGGSLSDTIGRKKTFTISLVLMTLSLLAFLNTSGLVSILFLIMLGFWAQTTGPVGLTYASELGPAEKAGMYVGVFFGGFQGLGLMATIVVGYTADLMGFYWAFMSLVLISGLAAILTMVLPKIKNGEHEITRDQLPRGHYQLSSRKLPQ
ncbi:MAG: MFS transporter [Methanobacteriota archaeon]